MWATACVMRSRYSFRHLGQSRSNDWAKAGWTSQTRHDAAYVELPNGRKFVLVTCTENHANERKILATIAAEVREVFAR